MAGWTPVAWLKDLTEPAMSLLTASPTKVPLPGEMMACCFFRAALRGSLLLLGDGEADWGGRPMPWLGEAPGSVPLPEPPGLADSRNPPAQASTTTGIPIAVSSDRFTCTSHLQAPPGPPSTWVLRPGL